MANLAASFGALTGGRDGALIPFPWQFRLYEDFRVGSVPRALGVPTGLGKTSVMALWLLARASGADVPRRLVYVVDRRAVVDQATDVAVGLRAGLEALPDLKAALGLDGPLPISTLRGQHADNRDWLADPAAPAIIVGTIDMIGSRLLFEGYGVSRGMRPFQAGLLGTDALVVLDEAHLVPPFEALVAQIADGAPHFWPRGDDGEPRPLRLLSLSATQRGGVGSDDVFRLDAEDRAHPIVAARLDAAKRLERSPVAAPLEGALADAAWGLAVEGPRPARVVVYSSSRDIAQKVHETLSDRLAATGGEALLLVGARRVHERAAVANDLERLGFIASTEHVPEAPALLVATAAGEVGIDLDAEHMVSDLVEWERMVQRLGRVNRRGRGTARMIVLDAGEEKSPSSADLGAVRRLLDLLPAAGEGARQAGPGALGDVAADRPDLVEAGSTPAPLRPALTRPLVEAWALTALREHTGRPEIAPWLRGWVEIVPQTTLAWRTHLPVRRGAVPEAEVEAFFRAAPVHLTEMLETETHRVAKWLYDRARALAKSGAVQDSETVAFLLAPDRSLRGRVTLGEISVDFRNDKRRRDRFESSLQDATLVLDARLGGLSAGLLDPKQDEAPETADEAPDGGEWNVGFRIERRPAEAEQPPGWRETFRIAVALDGDGDPLDVLSVAGNRGEGPEEGAKARVPQTLADHTAMVVAEARSLGVRLGLAEQDVALLALAARLHDTGKAAACWQKAMRAPGQGGPWAKTRGGDGRALAGYRHEFGSLLAALDDPETRALEPEARDLVLHLIAAHHGHARPGLRVDGCKAGPPSALEGAARDAALRFARLQAAWGPWGLAWWEALLRAADQRASKRAEDGNG